MKSLFVLIFILFTWLEASEPNIQLEYFIDQNDTLDIADVIHHKDIFKTQLNTNTNNLKINKHTLWVKVKLNNTTSKKQIRILEFLDIRIRHLWVYDRHKHLLQTSGNMEPFSNRTYKNAQIAIDLEAYPFSSQTYYLKIKNKKYIDLTYKLYTKQKFYETTSDRKIYRAFYFGALLIMLLYNFVLYIFIKDKSTLEYVIYHIVLTAVMLYYNGLMVEYLFPNSSNVGAGGVPRYLTYLAIIFNISFTRTFLNMKKLTPRLDKLFKYSIIMVSVLLFMHIFGLDIYFYQLGIKIIIPMSVMLILVSGYHAFIIKNEIAFFYFAGWSIMMISVIVTGLLSLGYIERTDFSSQLFQIGSLIEITLFSMGLAYRYNTAQKIIYQKDTELVKINQQLEAMVLNRTYQLDQKIKETQKLLQNRELLFKELYHRVKNNLQMLVSIFSLQLSRDKDERAKVILTDIISRIKSLALIHEKLQTSDRIDSIDVQEYLTSLLKEIKRTYLIENFTYTIEAKNIYLDIEQVTSLGLILNELISNSFKHAFKEIENPNIIINIIETNSGNISLMYGDNGVGSKDVRTSKSLGSTIIKTLSTSQLKGSLQINTTPSLNYTIQFQKKL